MATATLANWPHRCVLPPVSHFELSTARHVPVCPHQKCKCYFPRRDQGPHLIHGSLGHSSQLPFHGRNKKPCTITSRLVTINSLLLERGCGTDHVKTSSLLLELQQLRRNYSLIYLCSHIHQLRIWSDRCHCHPQTPLSLAWVKSRMIFNLSGTSLPRMFWKKAVKPCF